MNKYEAFTGFCPTQQKTYDVQVEYVDATSYADASRVFKKGNVVCDYCRQGNLCDFEYDCPAIKDAPSRT